MVEDDWYCIISNCWRELLGLIGVVPRTVRTLPVFMAGTVCKQNTWSIARDEHICSLKRREILGNLGLIFGGYIEEIQLFINSIFKVVAHPCHSAQGHPVLEFETHQ